MCREMLEVKAFQTLLASMCLGQGVQAKPPSPRSLAVGGQKVREESWLVRCCLQAEGQAGQAPSQLFLTEYLSFFCFNSLT